MASKAPSLNNKFYKLFINNGYLDFSLQFTSSSLPLGLEALAMSAPWSEELNQPDILAVDHELKSQIIIKYIKLLKYLFEVRIGKFNNVVSTSASTSLSGSRASRRLSSQTSRHSLLDLSQDGISDSLSSSAA